MDKREVINVACSVGVGTLTYLLLCKTQGNKEDRRYQKIRQALENSSTDLPIEEAGDPGKDEFDNSNMVAEGSQFGVHYYNKVKQ